MRLVVKSLLPGIFGAAILLAAAAAQADGPAAERRPPRIIFGESEATAFQFREFRPLRRSDASSRSEEHTSELQSLMRISYAVFCLKKKKQQKTTNNTHYTPKECNRPQPHQHNNLQKTSTTITA